MQEKLPEPKPLEAVKEAEPKTAEASKEGVEKLAKENLEAQKQVATKLKTMASAVSFYGKANPEAMGECKHIAEDILKLQIKIQIASEVKEDKIDQFLNDYNSLIGEVSQIIPEINSIINTYTPVVVSKPVEVEPTTVTLPASTPEPKAETTPIALTDFDDLTKEEEPKPDDQTKDPEYRAIMEENLDDVVAKLGEEERISDEQKQKENMVTDIVDEINGDSEPKSASRLVRQLWESVHNKMGEVLSVSPYADNLNLEFNMKDGNTKIVELSKLDKFAGRSLKRFEEKYLSKLPNVEEVVQEIDMGGEKAAKEFEPIANTGSLENDDQSYASLDSKSGKKILGGNGEVIL